MEQRLEILQQFIHERNKPFNQSNHFFFNHTMFIITIDFLSISPVIFPGKLNAKPELNLNKTGRN